MFKFAIEWRMRPDNPVVGIRKWSEGPRQTWLRDDELKRLTAALEKHPRRDAANAIRLILLTGARKGEVLSAEWSQFDLERAAWTKPLAHTKQKRTEHVPLSAAAVQLLAEMKGNGDAGEHRFLFPGRLKGRPIENVKDAWAEICKAAELGGVRVHDLRHTYASHLVSSGIPLAIVGKLLGHTQSQTTERYAHLADSALRKATELFCRKVERPPQAKRRDVGTAVGEQKKEPSLGWGASRARA